MLFGEVGLGKFYGVFPTSTMAEIFLNFSCRIRGLSVIPPVHTQTKTKPEVSVDKRWLCPSNDER